MADKSPSRPIIVAIAGGSATGKTTLARALAAALPDLSPLIISQDDLDWGLDRIEDAIRA